MNRAPGSRWVLAGWIVGIMLTGAAAYGVFRGTRPPDSPPAARSNAPRGSESSLPPNAELPPLPLAEVRFANVAPGVAFVGAEACRQCHAEEHASYLATPHSRALAPLATSERPSAAPAGSEFRHPRTGREYEVLTSDREMRPSEMRHSETLLDSAGNPALAADWPLAWAIGSGNHTQSYLVQVDEWLVESPITWYASTGRWDLSPGYDRPGNPSFERIADLGCLVCHAGRVESRGGSRYRVNIHEQAISCESCHGPGGLHVARHEHSTGAIGSGELAGEPDSTIVHPGRLDRAASESLCAQCHLRGAATVPTRGRTITDYRPGQRLEDFRVDYVLSRQSEVMNVVGHVEQMRLSACYQKSESLTCLSCHDPHASPAVAERVGFYRAKCLACHDDCAQAEVERRRQQPDDDCAACHMPRRPTDLQHVAFTHHRIGLHRPEAAAKGGEPPAERFIPTDELVPLAVPADWPDAERKRSLGLAWLEFAEKNQTSAASQEVLRSRAGRLLESAYGEGMRDASTVAALARLSWERGNLRRARELAGETLRLPDRDSGAHTSAYVVLAAVARDEGNPAASAEALEHVVADRRQSQDWLLLGECRLELGNFAGAVAAFEKAAEIHPFRPDVHEALSAAYLNLRDSPRAALHRKLAEQLREPAAP
jgi:hypothetical protein